MQKSKQNEIVRSGWTHINWDCYLFNTYDKRNYDQLFNASAFSPLNRVLRLKGLLKLQKIISTKTVIHIRLGDFQEIDPSLEKLNLSIRNAHGSLIRMCTASFLIGLRSSFSLFANYFGQMLSLFFLGAIQIREGICSRDSISRLPTVFLGRKPQLLCFQN